MQALTWLRRRPLLLLAVVAAALAVGAVASADGFGPSTLGFTPQKADQVTNIDVLRQQLKNYFGTPDAKTGSTAPADQYASSGSNYAREVESVAADGTRWLASQAKKWAPKAKAKPSDKTPAIVLDVDDTTLSTWNYELVSNWDYNPTTNGDFVNGELFPPVPGMVDMVNQAAAEGYAVFFITGRPTSQYDTTLGNLTDSDSIGLDAGYPDPVALYTKPDVADYPDYLQEACKDATGSVVKCTTIQYKSATRKHIEDLGYEIVANFGDQYSDLEGGYAERAFKLPNPNYYLP